MQIAGRETYMPESDAVNEAPEGIWFMMSDGQSQIRCLVERSAWRARALHNGDMAGAVLRNWPAITALAARKLLLMAPPPTELHLTADDLFKIAWREWREERPES